MEARPRSYWVLALALACLLLPRSAAAASQTIVFDDLTSPNRVLSGQYPSGVIDWGTNAWYLSGPFGAFTTNSIGFNGSGPRSGSFTFLTPRRLLQLDAYNGGSVASTITIACSGQTTAQLSLAVRQVATMSTGWTATCSSVTIGSSNG